MRWSGRTALTTRSNTHPVAFIPIRWKTSGVSSPHDHGTYVAIEPFHLTAYLDEQTHRFNNRTLNDGQRFNSVLGMVSGRGTTYARSLARSGEQRPELPN